MVLNPAGFQQVFDWGNPKIISGRAREALSGGQLCVISGASAIVSSGANSFTNTTDVLFSAGASGLEFTGIVLYNAGSNLPVSVATNVCAIVTAAGTIVAGRNVGVNGADAVIETATAGRTVGRALTTAGSEGYCLVNIGQV